MSHQTLLVVVVGDGPELAVTVDAVRAQPLPDDIGLLVHTAPLVGCAADSWTSAVQSQPYTTYQAFIRAGSTPGPRWLASGIEALRADPTLAAAVPSRGDTVEDALVVGDGAVVRRFYWSRVGGFEVDVPPALASLHAGWRLWMLGYRVRGFPGVEIAGSAEALPPVDGPQLQPALARLLRELPPGIEQDLRARRPASMRRRDHLQSARRRSDGELLRMVAEELATLEVGPAVRDALVALGAEERLTALPRVVVFTTDTLGSAMAGPAIRSVRMARSLAEAGHEVVLATMNTCTLPSTERLTMESVDDVRFRELTTWCDVLVVQGWGMAGREWILDEPIAVIADLYDPIHLEQLEQARHHARDWEYWMAVRSSIEVLSVQVRRADYFICASEKQRDLWIGMLSSLGRLNPMTYELDETGRTLLDVVPFGVAAAPPDERGGIRGAIPGIGADDLVLLWGGGVYNWFDPLTLIRAVDKLRSTHPNIRLVFLGMRHPNPGVPTMKMALDAVSLAEELGISGTHVFFNESWVPYDDRHRFFQDADIGVSTHLDRIETEFSYRTRILDYLWSGLPCVATAGDALADLIDREGLGRVVPAGDVDALVAAIDELASDPAKRADCRDRIAEIVPDMRWDRCAEPLVAYASSARRSPDVACLDIAGALLEGIDEPILKKVRARRLRAFTTTFRTGGTTLVLRRVRYHAGRLARRTRS